MREPDENLSIFDDDAFNFYIVKYGEILGLDSLLIAQSSDRKMSYDQKRKIISFIVQTENDLKVVESSWKHCLLFLLHNGSITKEELFNEFTSKEQIRKS